jgi:hypothetical protein
MIVKVKENRKKSSPALAKGQLWKMDHTHIQIVELGKMLVHYKMLRELGQMRRTQMSRIDSMESYLKENAATLVKGKGPTVTMKAASRASCPRLGRRKGR